MNNKDIILFILTLIVLYLLFCNMNRPKETFTPSTTSTPFTKKPNNLPIGDLKRLITNMVDNELKDNNLNQVPTEYISVVDSIKEFGKFIRDTNEGKTSKLDILTVGDITLCSQDEKDKYTFEVKDNNLVVKKVGSNEGNFRILGSLDTTRDIKITGAFGEINTNNNINITRGNLNIKNGNISTHNDIFIVNNQSVKWFDQENEFTNNKIRSDNQGYMYINWDKDGSKVFFDSLYSVNVIELEGMLNFKKHKWGNKELNDAKHYYYTKATGINNTKKYLKINPYTNGVYVNERGTPIQGSGSGGGNCILCKEVNPYRDYVNNLEIMIAVSPRETKEYYNKSIDFDIEQMKKYSIKNDDYHTYSFIVVEKENEQNRAEVLNSFNAGVIKLLESRKYSL